MPTVDIPTPSNTAASGGGKSGLFGLGLPTPVLLALVGGGVGLVVFLRRNASSGSSQDPGGGKGTLLPNTAIMLGSLQQGVLQLQGDVTQGNADLSSQLSGVGENLSAQIDAQSAQTQQAFGDLNSYLGTNFGAIAGSEVSLSQALAGIGTQNSSLADALATALQGITGLQGSSASILNQVNNIYNTQTVTTAQLNQLGQSLGMTQAEIAQVNAGLGGSIGTAKGEILTLAYALGKGQSVQDYLKGQGDYTQSGQTHQG